MQTYALDNYWFALVYVQDDGNIRMLYWMAWRQNVEIFPEWGQAAPVVWNGIAGDLKEVRTVAVGHRCESTLFAV